MTAGRGPDAVIDAVGMEAHGSPVAKTRQRPSACCPTRSPADDRPTSASTGWTPCSPPSRRYARRRHVSISGVYGGEADPMPMMELFDRGLQLRMGQATSSGGSTRSCRWSSTTPIPRDRGPGHAPASSRAPAHGYEIFQKKKDACIKVLLNP